jgi:hypothetical protein
MPDEAVAPPEALQTDPDTLDPVEPDDPPLLELGEAEGKDPYGDRDDVVQDDRAEVDDEEVTS